MIVINMDMPKRCFDCDLWGDDGECDITGELVNENGRGEICPIVGEIPKQESADYRCFMCEEKEKAYLAGYREGLKAGESALNEGSKDESIN